MTRIVLTLGWFAILMVAAALILGLTISDLRNATDESTVAWARVHRMMGVAAALVVVLVNSIIITYFVGTSRWCKEVVETYQLDRSYIVRANRLKRRTFPWAVLAMLAMVVIVALGGAADPLNGSPTGERWVVPHLISALAGLTLVAWVLFVEWNNIHANYGIISEIMGEVGRVRRDRGLDVEQSADTVAEKA